MSELADLIKTADTPDPFRTARVISVNKHLLTVDFGSGVAGTVVQATDSCNPVPNQTVIIAMDGNRPVAVGALGGPYRQQTMIATGSSSTTATGLVNGVSKAVTKIGTFTVTNGDELPLLWAADGSEVWVAAKAGVAYVPPAGGGGGTGGGGSSTYTTNYATRSSGWNISGSAGGSGDLTLYSGRVGFFAYGTNRMNELQGKTIQSARILLQRVSGSGSVSVRVGKGALLGSSTIVPNGWMTLPLARVADMVNGSGSVYLYITGSGTLRGTPSGTVQITWKK